MSGERIKETSSWRPSTLAGCNGGKGFVLIAVVRGAEVLRGCAYSSFGKWFPVVPWSALRPAFKTKREAFRFVESASKKAPVFA